MTTTAWVALSRLASAPVAKQNYLDLAYLGTPPAELGPGEEANLPARLQNGYRGR